MLMAHCEVCVFRPSPVIVRLRPSATERYNNDVHRSNLWGIDAITGNIERSHFSVCTEPFEVYYVL